MSRGLLHLEERVGEREPPERRRPEGGRRAVIDRRSEPEFRAVAEDAAVEAGGSLRWLGRVGTDAADAEADADADAVDIHAVNQFFRGDEMREGLLLVTLPGRYWSVTRVGWAHRVAGDEWELRGAITVTRQGAAVPLDAMAARGLPSGHTASKPALVPELLHRLTVRRVLVADEKAWAKLCPRPEASRD